MMRAIRLVLIAATLISAAAWGPFWAPAWAADMRTDLATPPAKLLPFPRSDRAQSVWASSACFRDCGAYCTWGQTSCLYRDSQGQCLKLTDDCDRYCQRSCRTAGGPWLPLDF